MTHRRKPIKKAYTLFLPKGLLEIFAAAAAVLVPWILWLSHSLPPVHLDQRWNLVWSGLDIAEFITLALTAYLGFRRSGWVVISASMAGTFLLVDAWFDSLTARNGSEHLTAVVLAIFVEVPLSLLAFWIAYRAGKYFFKC